MQLFRVKSSALQALQVSNLCPSVNSDPTRDANSGVPMGGGGVKGFWNLPLPPSCLFTWFKSAIIEVLICQWFQQWFVCQQWVHEPTFGMSIQS